MWNKRDDMVVHQAEPFNAEPPPAALADRALTPVEAFYSRNHGTVPRIDPAAWRLRVDGFVATPLELGLDDLRDRFEPVTLTATLQCAGNRRVGLLAVRDIPGEAPWGATATSTATWTGVRLADVLAAAGVDGERAAHVAFEAPDVATDAAPPQPYGSSIPYSKALGHEVLLAWAMNGAPLAPLHGAPVRVVVPGYIGARSVKWIERVTVLDQPSASYFQAVAYRLLPPDADPGNATGDGFALGPVALNVGVLRPEDGAEVSPGTTEVAGYAFAGEHRRVARVDLSVDGGESWSQAALDDEPDAWAWQLWRATVHLAPGDHEVLVRAWDSTGACQPASPHDVWNPKGYVNNSWERVRVTARATAPGT